MIPNVRQIHTKLYIGSSDGITWLDLSDHFVRAAVNKGDVTQLGASGVDGVIASADFSLRRRGPVYTLDPGSSPILFPNREIMLRVAITAPGVEPSSWVTLFHGLLGDSISYSDTTVDLTCRDMAKLLGDCYVEEVQQYGSDEGAPLETVLQQIIDANLGVGEALVYCPVSPGFMVTPYQVEHKSVWDAIQEAVGQAGCFIGYRWDPNTTQYRLTLLEVPRDKDASTADFALTWTDDIYVEQLDITDRDIRNAVKVTYRDAATGQRRSVTVTDEASIGQFRRRAMQIEEADTSLIDTEEEALRFANAALADLSQLTSTNRIEMPLLPELDIMHGITITNPRMSENEKFYGVESVRHTIDYGSNKFRTEVIASGRVIGGHNRWLRMQTRPGSPGEPDYPLPITDIPPDTPAWDTCEFVRDVTLRWHPVARAVEYEIRRVDADWGTELGRVWHGTETTAVIAPQSRSETFYLRARDAGGRYSQTSAIKTLTNATPSTPPQPTVQEFFSCLWITINPVADNDIVSYNLYMTPVDEEGDPTGDTQVTTYLSAGRITYNASPGTRFKIEVAAADVLGEGGKSTPIYAETTDLDEMTIPDWVRDPIENISDKWVVDTDEDGNLIGLVRVEDGEQHSHIAVLADVFSIATPEGRKPVFVFDTQEKKLYILGDLIAEGLIRATEIQSELAKHLLLQAQLATIDEADVLWLRADKITIGGEAPGIPLMKPEGAHLFPFNGSLMSTDGISPVGTPVATLRPDGRFGGCVAVEVGTENYLANPLFAEGLTAWFTYNWGGGGVAYYDDTIRTPLGTGAAVLDLESATADIYLGQQNITLPDTTSDYTISVLVRSLDGKSTTLQTYSGSDYYWLGVVPSNGEWVVLKRTFHAGEYPQTGLRNVRFPIGEPSKKIAIGGMQIERHSIGTSITNGVRPAGILSYDILPGIEAGTVAFWARYNKTAYEYVPYPYFISGGYSGSKWAAGNSTFGLRRQDFRVFNDSGQVLTIPVPDGLITGLNDGEWFYAGITWKHTGTNEWTYRLAVGSHLGYGLAERVSSVVPADLTQLYVGSTGAGSGTISGTWFDELLVWNHAATPEQIAAWYAMGAPFVDPDSAINADASPISAARGQVYIGEPGIAVANGAMIFVSGTFSHDQLGRLITAAVDRPITTDPGGQKSVSAPVEISAARGHEVYKGKLNVWAGTGGAGDTRYIHDGRVTDDGIIGMDALKLTGTVAMENLPAHLLRTAPGVSGAVMYYARTHIVELGPKATMQLTFTTAMPYVPELFVMDRRGFLSGTLEFDNVSKTGFRITNPDEDTWIRPYDNVSFFWIALCASHDPSTSSCDNCQEECQGDCQQSGCQTSCEGAAGCQQGCELGGQIPCDGTCQDVCMFSCQLPPPNLLWI